MLLISPLKILCCDGLDNVILMSTSNVGFYEEKKEDKIYL